MADYRRQFERTTRTVGEDPATFAAALEILAVKAFGDMGQMTAYVVGDADMTSETTRVAAVTGQRSGTNQLEVFTSSVTNNRGISGPTGDGNTESSTSGCESSSTDIIRMDDALIPRGTAPTTATATATATRPTRLERRGVFLLWEVGSCSNTMPELE